MTFNYFLEELQQSIFAAKLDLPYSDEIKTFEEWLQFFIEWSRLKEDNASLENLKYKRAFINSEINSIE